MGISKAAKRRYDKKYNKANAEAILHKRRIWRKAHKAEIAEYDALWKRRKENPDEWKAYRERQTRVSIAKLHVESWTARNPAKVKANHWRHHLMKAYGLTVEQYDAMLLQTGGVCPCCNGKIDSRSPLTKPHVDHDHETGDVRGIICGSCNMGLGNFKDSSERLRLAATYLDNRKARQTGG